MARILEHKYNGVTYCVRAEQKDVLNQALKELKLSPCNKISSEFHGDFEFNVTTPTHYSKFCFIF